MYARLISSRSAPAAKEGYCLGGYIPDEAGDCYVLGTMPQFIGDCWGGFIPQELPH